MNNMEKFCQLIMDHPEICGELLELIQKQTESKEKANIKEGVSKPEAISNL